MDEDEQDFKIPEDGEIMEEGEEEDPLKMDGFHEEGAEPEMDF